MIKVTTNQALERWDTLPDILRDALFSEPNSDFLWRTCSDEYVPEKKIYEVAKVAGYVMMGFLHPEDVALEIIERLALDRKTATDIQNALSKRIFAPLQADLEKVYNPLGKFDVSSNIAPKVSANGGPSPKMVFDMVSGSSAQASLKPLNSVAPKPGAPTPSAIAAPISQKPISAVLSSIPPNTSATPTPTKIPSASEGKFAPPPFSQAGWSKTTSSPVQSQQPPQAKPPTAPSGLAPIILHEDAKFTSSEKTTDFHLARPGGGAEVSLEGVKSQQVARPAVLELGSLANAPAKPGSVAPKFTHYTQFQIATQPIDRHVTEITASTPKPTQSPAPSKPVTPTPTPAIAKPAPPAVPQVKYPVVPPTAPAPKPAAAAPTPPAPPKPPAPAMPQPPKPPSPPQAQEKVVKINYP